MGDSMELSNLFDKNGKPSARKISANPDLVQNVIESTSWLPATAQIAERLWNLENNFSSYTKTCRCCSKNITVFRSWTDGYKADFCSISCQRKYSLAKVRKPKPVKIPVSKEESNAKRVKTSLERYGSEFPWQNKDVKARASAKILNNTFNRWVEQLSTYDLGMVSSFSEYIGNRSDMQVKCLKCDSAFSLKRFSNEHGEDLNHACPVCHPPKASRGQHEIVDFIKSMGLSCIMNNRTVIKPYELDIYVPSHGIAIEFDGLYWHSERGRPGIKHSLSEKLKLIAQSDIQVVFINEGEWNNQQEKVKSRLKSLFGKCDRVFARKCEIKAVPKQVAQKFFQDNHIQNSVGMNQCLGLYLNDELVSAMSFGKPRFAKYDTEILRFCSKLNLTVVGAASRLLNHFKKLNSTDSIISYADLRWGKGNVYEKMNMTYMGHTGLSYFYVSVNGKILNRSSCQKHKLKSFENYDITKTEKQIMEENGYSRFWTPGNSKWVYIP